MSRPATTIRPPLGDRPLAPAGGRPAARARGPPRETARSTSARMDVARSRRRPSTRTRARRPAASAASSTSRDERDEGRRVGAGDPALEGQPGERPVEQAGVAEAVAELAGRPPPRRCSCPTMPGRRGRRRAAGRQRTVHRLRIPAARAGRRLGTRGAAATRRRAPDLGRRQRPDSPLCRSSSRSVPRRTRTSRSTGASDRREHPPELALPALAEGRPVPGQLGRRAAGGPPPACAISSVVIGRRWVSVGEALLEADARREASACWASSSGRRRPSAYSRSTPKRGWRTRSAHGPSLVSRSRPSESWSSRPTG